MYPKYLLRAFNECLLHITSNVLLYARCAMSILSPSTFDWIVLLRVLPRFSLFLHGPFGQFVGSTIPGRFFLNSKRGPSIFIQNTRSWCLGGKMSFGKKNKQIVIYGKVHVHHKFIWAQMLPHYMMCIFVCIYGVRFCVSVCIGLYRYIWLYYMYTLRQASIFPKVISGEKPFSPGNSVGVLTMG